MTKIDIDNNLLMKALENNKNETIIHLTSEKIKNMNLKILNELYLNKEITKKYLTKLKNYKYIDELNDIKIGAFIKWIPITNPDYLPLNLGGFISEIKMDDEGTIIVLKNFMNNYYQIKIDECLIFQKLTSQELIILNALDYLSKK